MSTLLFLLYATIVVVSSLYAGRVLAALLCHVIPKLLPASWGKVQIRTRPLTLLRAQGLTFTSELLPLECVRMNDVCFFREVEWSRTFMRWLLEFSFPIGIRGIDIHLSWNALKSAPIQPSTPTASPLATRVKKRRRLKPAPWTWRLLFRLLSHILINISDVKIHLEDLNLEMHLENLAVVFKSERGTPCRAALKAKALKSVLKQPDTDSFCFFELSDVAATATITQSRATAFPEWNLLKVALGSIAVDINDYLIERSIKAIKQFPEKRLTTRTKTISSKSKSLVGDFLPQKIGGGIHRLGISFIATNEVPMLNSSVTLHSLQMGMDTSIRESKVQLDGRVRAIEICGGKPSDTAQAVLISMPNVSWEGGVWNKEGNLRIDGQLEFTSIQISIDDSLIWSGIGVAKERIEMWRSISGTQKDEARSLTSIETRDGVDGDGRLGSPNQEGWTVWKEDPFKDGSDLGRVYRHILDSGDLGMLREAEEEEPTVDVTFEATAADVESTKSVLTKLRQLEWVVTVGVTRTASIVLVRRPEDAQPLKLEATAISLYSKLGEFSNQKQQADLELQLERVCMMTDGISGKNCGSQVEPLLQIVNTAVMVDGSLESEDERAEIICFINGQASVHDVLLTLASATQLQELLILWAEMRRHATKDCKEFNHQMPKNENPTRSSHLLSVRQDWSVKIANIIIKYLTNLKPVPKHARAQYQSTECSVELELTDTVVTSGTRLPESHLSVQAVTIGWGSDCEEIRVLRMTELILKLQKPQALTSIEILLSSAMIEAEVDTVVLAMQVAEEVLLLKTQAKTLMRHEAQQNLPAVSTENRTNVPSCSTRAVHVRIPNSALSLMRRIYVGFKVTQFTAKCSIAESDVILLCLKNTSIVADRSTPKAAIDHVKVDVNKARVLECTSVHLKIRGPCFLSELSRTCSTTPRSRRATVTKSTSSLTADHEAESEGNAEVMSKDDQMQIWRTDGCHTMGIAEYVEEEHVMGEVLDFLSIDMEVDTASVIVPHDQHLGRLNMFTEQWADAIREWMHDRVEEIKKLIGEVPEERKTGSRGLTDLVDISITANRVVFRLDSHPLEAWLALHGHRLRETAILKNAWENVVRNLKDDFGEKLEMDIATNGASAAVFCDYYDWCSKLRERTRSSMFHHGACMCITAEKTSGLILVGDRKSPRIFTATVRKIKELDHPTSNDITFSSVQPIYIAATVSSVHAHFSGVDKPSVSVASINFSGLIARGRQMTHNPKVCTELYRIGRWHEVRRSLPIKGTRPPMKVYTDMTGQLLKLDANGGIGLEPIFCQLSKAFNRLTPPSQVNGDGSLPSFSGHTLQSWDKIRYTWRGRMCVEIQQMTAAVAADTSSFVNCQTPRIEVQADHLNADIVAGGVVVEAVQLGITLFSPGLRPAPDAALHDLPLCLWPRASIKILYTWHMPQKRSPLLHYAFPVVNQPDPDVLLETVDLFQLFVGEGYTLEIHADFDNKEKADSPDPKIIMGEEQIRFLIRFFQLMEKAPARIRGCWKRGSYFFKKDSRKKCITPELHNLLHRIVVSLKTPRLAVEHFVWETEDPSDSLLVTCNKVLFNGTWAFLDKIEEANARRGGRFLKKSRYREVNGVWRHVKGKNPLPDMEDLAVSATNVEGFLPEVHSVHPILIREAPETDTKLWSLLTETSIADKTSEASKPPDGMKGRILTANTFNLKQRGSRVKRSEMSSEPDDVQVTMPSGEIKRPIHIQLEDVKLVMPLEVRNAVLGVYMHMLSAFTGPPCSAASKEKKISDSIPVEQLQERRNEQEEQRTMQRSTDSQLLTELLRQDNEGTGPSAEPRRSVSVDDMQRVDPAPEGSKMILQMEFSNVQLSCLSSVSMGGILVCLQSGRLHEYFSEVDQIRTMTLQLHQVQAYHMDTKIDPMNPIRWLDRVETSLMIPSDSRDILTRIVQPFEAELSDLHLMMLAQARNPGRAAEELKIQSSRIEALTNFEQFEILIDVINSLATPPPPDIKLMRDIILGPAGSALEDTSEAISEAKATLKETYRGFNDLRQQAYELSLIASPVVTQSKLSENMSRESAKGFLLTSLSSGDGDVSRCRKHIAFAQNIVDEQIEVARKVCYQTTSTLQEVRHHVAATNKHKKLYKSLKMQISVGNVVWQIINKSMAVFMLAEIKRVVFKSFQNKDLSGESSVSVYRLELRDPRGEVDAGSGLESGVVLSVLEPTGADEEVLRGLAIRGAQTSSHVYYDHIEAWVHRFGLNFNETIAAELAAFFFPGTDEEIVRKREEDWAKFRDYRRDQEQESESADRMSRRDSLTLSMKNRPRALSYLEPIVCATISGHRQHISLSNVPVVPPECDPLQLSVVNAAHPPRRKKKKGLVKPRKIYFVHGLTITLGMSEYNSLEGSWRGLFKKYRNGVIGSVIKSIATHEGRSYDPSLVLLGDSQKEEKIHSGPGFFSGGRRFFRKKEKWTRSPSEEEDEEMPVDVVDEKAEQASRDLFLGKRL